MKNSCLKILICLSDYLKTYSNSNGEAGRLGENLWWYDAGSEYQDWLQDGREFVYDPVGWAHWRVAQEEAVGVHQTADLAPGFHGYQEETASKSLWRSSDAHL